MKSVDEKKRKFQDILTKFPDFSRFSLTKKNFPDFSRFSRFSRLLRTMLSLERIPFAQESSRENITMIVIINSVLLVFRDIL